MRIKVDVGATKKMRDGLRAFGKRAGVTANRAGDIMAERLIQLIQDEIYNGPKTGRLYKRYNPRRLHRASAPGQSPANDQGTLARSFTAKQVKLNQYAYKNIVGSNLVYAAALQYGNPEQNLLPRPYFTTAIRRLRAEAPEMVRGAWRRSA